MSAFRKTFVCLTLAISAFGVMAALSGCGNSIERGHVAQPMTSQQVDARIKAIQADPHMPQFAKDAQIGRLRAAQSGALKNGH